MGVNRETWFSGKNGLPLVPSSEGKDDPRTDERKDRGKGGEWDPRHIAVQRHLDLRSLPGTEVEGIPVVLVSGKPYHYLMGSRRY